MDDAIVHEAAWQPMDKLPENGSGSPYVHWALGKTPSVAVDASNLFNIRTSWLKKAVQKIMGEAPKKWPGLVAQVLPKTCLGPVKPAKRAKGSRTLPHAQNKVIMALIDDGVAFAQERFRKSGLNSRVDYLWLQGAERDPSGSPAPFGREMRGPDVDRMLRRHRTSGKGDMVDEETLYRETGALDMASGTFQSLARRAGHGTAVIDLASGFSLDSFRRDRMFKSLPDRMGVDPETYDLALVSIPQSVTADTSGTYVDIFIIAGLVRLLDYVEQRCLEDGQDYPVVLNLSFGLTAGPKDGSSLLDRFIDGLPTYRGAGRAPLRVVVPSGNHRLARSCARLAAPLEQESEPLFWSLQPDDKTPSFMEIWSGTLSRKPELLPITLALKPPNGDAAPTLYGAEFGWVYHLDIPPTGFIRAYVDWVPSEGKGGRYRVCIAVPATLPTAPKKPWVSPGDWQIIITATPGQDVGWPLDLSIQRDDMIPGFRSGGRQSRFSHAHYIERDEAGFVIKNDPDWRSPIRREGTINSMATARDTVVVGGCFADTLETVPYSGTGHSNMGMRVPDANAPASISRRRGGISAAGNRSGSRVGVEGTSVAAPTMARELAKASRPAAERPKLSGVPLLRSSMSPWVVPTVLPVAEDLESTVERWGDDKAAATVQF